jgi:DHA1 family tetracycline resistance protein-like MFS transporter
MVVCLCFGWSFFYEFLPVVWIADLGFDAKTVGIFYAYGAGIYALSSGMLIRPFQKWFRPYVLVFYSLVLLGCVILSLLFFRQAFWIWFYLPVVNFLIALIYPTYSAIVSDAVDENSQGEVLGILQSIQMFAFGISPLFGGGALGIHPLAPMLLGGGFMLLGACIFGLFLRKKIFKYGKRF